MLNKLFKLFGYELVKLKSLKDIAFDKEDSEDEFDFPKEIIPIKEEEEVVKPKVKKKNTSLTILFKDDKSLSWETLNDFDNKSFPYADLYTWFFSRTTPLFMFRHNNGETIFRREDIVRIERTKTITVDKD